MGLANMTVRRIRKLIAWAMAIVVLALLGAGVFWIVTELGWVA